MRYDVIVVGAGPAGSTTARECSGQGLSVLLIDRAAFPRDKPCGGGVTKRAYDLLPVDISPVVERVIFGLDLTLRQSLGVSRRSPAVITYLTQRSRLDAFLVERAIKAGVVLRERVLLRQVERHPSYVTIRTSQGVFEGSTLVAADGANGSTARLAGLNVGLVNGIALEGNISTEGSFPERWDSSVGMDFGGTPGGYGWIFPKGDHLNFGVGGWKYLGPSLRTRLDGLVRFYGFDPNDICDLRGHHLPLRQPSSPLANGNILLVGDAAGLLDPFTGEGIHAAFWSGQTAARHLKEYVAGQVEDLSGYSLEVEHDLVPDLRISRQFQDLFNLTPAIYMRVEWATSVLWSFACRILRGEQTYASVMRSHTTLATIIEFVSDLVRVTPCLQRAAGLRDPAPPQRFFLGDSHPGS